MQQQTHYNSDSLWDKVWKDTSGKVVVWQWPNRWLIAWAVLTGLSLALNGRAADICSTAGSVALLAWSALEIFKGVNYFRRALGALVFLFAITSLIKSF